MRISTHGNTLIWLPLTWVASKVQQNYLGAQPNPRGFSSPQTLWPISSPTGRTSCWSWQTNSHQLLSARNQAPQIHLPEGSVSYLLLFVRDVAVKHVRFCLRFKAAKPLAPKVLDTSCFSQNFCTILHSKKSRQLLLHSTFFGAANPIPYTQDSLLVYTTYF